MPRSAGATGGVFPATRASCGLGTTSEDMEALLGALGALTAGLPAPVNYVQDSVTGDFWPKVTPAGKAWPTPGRRPCAAGLRSPEVPGVGGARPRRRGARAGRVYQYPGRQQFRPDVAWVATSASVTLPGKGITPVHLAAEKVGKQVVLGSLPSALAYTSGDAALLVVTQGDDTLHGVDPATHRVEHVAGVGVEPDAVAVAPGGRGARAWPWWPTSARNGDARRPGHVAAGPSHTRG